MGAVADQSRRETHRTVRTMNAVWADLFALRRLGAHREHEILWSPQTGKLYLVTIVCADPEIDMEIVKVYSVKPTPRPRDIRILKFKLSEEFYPQMRLRCVWPNDRRADQAPRGRLQRIHDARTGGCELMAVVDDIRPLRG